MDILHEQLRDLQKNQQEIQKSQLEMQKHQLEMQKIQKDILDKLTVFEEARKMKRKQGAESLEDGEEEVDEEALTKKKNKKWKPERLPCEKCGKMVASHWKGRHQSGYCKGPPVPQSGYCKGPPVPEGSVGKFVVRPPTPHHAFEEGDLGSDNESKTYSISSECHVVKYPEAILRSVLGRKGDSCGKTLANL